MTSQIKKTASKRILSLMLAVCMVLTLIPAISPSANAAVTSGYFGKDSSLPGSLEFRIDDTGLVNLYLYKFDSSGNYVQAYTSSSMTTKEAARYCTAPAMSFYVGTDHFTYDSYATTNSWGGSALGSGVVTYIADGVEVPNQSSTAWTGATIQQGVVTWTKSLSGDNVGKTATIKWIVQYVRGDSFFTHDWQISATNTSDGTPADIVGGIDLYYGGHHRLGGGSAGGWSAYNAVTNAIYTWGVAQNNNGVYVLRSDGAVSPKSYYTGATSTSYTGGTYSATIANAPKNRTDYTVYPQPGVSAQNGHTCFFMHWQEAGTLAAGKTWQVEATEGIVNEGDLTIMAPPGSTVPSNVTITYDFFVMNMYNGATTVDLKAALLDTTIGGSGAWPTDWEVKIDGSAIANPDELQIAFNYYGEVKSVAVDVTIPSGQTDGTTVDLTLEGKLNATSFVTSATTTTTIDSTVPAIINVMERNLTRNTLDVLVDYTVLTGVNDVTIEIYYEDGTGTGSTGLLPLTTGTGTIASGDLVRNIDVSMLVPGTVYRIKAIVDGVKYPNSQRTFTMRGDEASGYVWRDMNGDGIMSSFEGVYGVDVVLKDLTGGYTFETTSKSRGVVGFTTDTTGTQTHAHDPGNAYMIYPNLDPHVYAVESIRVYVDGVEVSSNITNDSTFEYLHLNAVYNGIPAIEYKFQSGKSAQISFEIGLALASVVEVYTHTGNITPPSAANYVTGGVAEATYTTSNTTGSIGSTITTVPYELSFPANSNAEISVSAPLGYRMADGYAITVSRPMYYLAPYSTAGAYPLYFQLVAGDIRLTGVTATSGSPSVSAANVNSAKSDVSVDTTWAGVTTRLDFSVWDSTASLVVNPTRTNYEWAIVSDSNSVFLATSFSTSNGTFMFSGNTGTATVKVTQKTAPYLSHQMDIVVTQGTAATYTDIYIAKADDTTLTKITDFALVTGATTEVVVVGYDSSTGSKTKLLINDVTLTSGDTSVITSTATSGSLYNFTIRGVSSGYNTLTAGYSALSLTASAGVLVTPYSLSGASITISPNPVNLTSSGGNEQVTYTLNFTSNTTMTLNPAAVTATVADTNKADLVSGTNDYLAYAGDGTTTLTAKLSALTAVTGSATVNCASGGAVVTPLGTLTLIEASGSTTGGFIEQGGTAEYLAFFDTNANGIYDAGTDTPLPYGTANTVFASASSKFTLGTGTISVNNVLLTGSTSTTGNDKLTVTYTYNGTDYTASADIVVYPNGYSYNRMEVTPSPTVLQVGESRTFTVKVVFKDTSGNTEVSYTLPTTMYTGSVSSGRSYASLTANNQVRGTAATGEAVYRATLTGDTTKSGEARILVVPVGAYLSVSPDPLWIKISASEAVSYQLLDSQGSAISVTGFTLTDYVTASIANHSVAEFTSGDINSVHSNAVGRTTLTANLTGQSTTTSVTVYVWDDSYNSNSGIVWNPPSLSINAGNTGSSTVYLINSSGTQTAAVNLEHLASLTVANESIASIPASPSGTALTVSGKSVTVNSATTVTAASPAGSAVLEVAVTTGATISGISATPTIIELWPGETKTVTIKNTGSGLSIDASQLNATTRTFTNFNENVVSVNTSTAVLEVTQDAGVPSGGSVNTMTVTLDGKSVTVYIINYTEDPYQPGITQSLELVMNPDPSWVVQGSAIDAAAVLTLTDTSNVVIDTITLPAAVVTWAANSTTSLPGRVALSAASTAGETITITGQSAGAQTYKVTYSGGTTPLTANGNVFVFAQSIGNIASFKFEPETVVLTPGDTQNMRGVINYSNGYIQYVTAQELPIAVPDLASDDMTTATVSINGIIKGMSLGVDSARSTYVEGTLIAAQLTGHTDVLVYDPNAAMSIDPASFVIYIPGGSPSQLNIQDIVTKIGSYTVPNLFLTYSASNNNVSLAAGSSADYVVTGVSVGTTTITSLLNTTVKSATAIAEVRDPNVTYYTVTYNDNTVSGATNSFVLASGSPHQVQPIGFSAPSGYYFGGWNTATDGSGTNYSVGSQFNVTGDITLYAQWTSSAPSSYTVTYDANGGGGTMNPYTDSPGTNHTVLSSTFTEPTGKQFKEWNTDANGAGTIYAPGATYIMNSDITLFAIWEDVCTVTYHANDGSGATTADTYVLGTIYTVLPNSFTPPNGMQFVKWNTASGGTGTSFVPTNAFILNTDIDLYAIWEPASATIYTVSGVVTDSATGDPIVGATVSISGYGSDTTDNNGEYSISGLPGGVTYTVTADESDYVAESINVLVNADVTDADIAMTHKTYTITGSVLDEDGKPMEGITVTIIDENNNTKTAITDQNGEYVFDNMPDGDYEIEVVVLGYETGEDTVKVSGGDETVDPIKLIPKDGDEYYKITGMVVDEDGKPVEGATVIITDENNNSYKTTTDEYGKYVFEDMPDGDYDIEVTKPYYESGEVGVKVDGDDAEAETIRLTPTASEGPSLVVVLSKNPIYVGDRTTVTAQTSGFDDPVTYTWSISNTSIARLSDTSSQSPTVRGVSAGTVTITCTATDGYTTLTDKVTLKVKEDAEEDTSSSGKVSFSGLGSAGSGTYTTIRGAETELALNTTDHFAYLNGYSDGTFRADDSITRAEVAQMLYNLLLDTSHSNTKSFSDVATGAWYYEAVVTLADKGVISGYPDGTFRPDATISRAEFVTMLSKFTNVSSGSMVYSDVPESHWAYSCIVSATTKGWITGYSDGTFRPERKITRAEAARVTNVLLGRTADKDYVNANPNVNHFSDLNSSHWAYYEVIEASVGHDYQRDANYSEIWFAIWNR